MEFCLSKQLYWLGGGRGGVERLPFVRAHPLGPAKIVCKKILENFCLAGLQICDSDWETVCRAVQKSLASNTLYRTYKICPCERAPEGGTEGSFSKIYASMLRLNCTLQQPRQLQLNCALKFMPFNQLCCLKTR